MKKKKTYFDLSVVHGHFSAAKHLWDDYTEAAGFEDNRKRKNVIIKHAFSVASREVTKLTLTDVGAIINKDHASILHAIRKHEENMRYLRGYADVYTTMHYQLHKYLHDGLLSNEVNSIDDVKELRSRLIETSSRLRMKIVEVNALHRQIKESPARAVEENKIIAKMLRETQKRNDLLNKENIRLKNLL